MHMLKKADVMGLLAYLDPSRIVSCIMKCITLGAT